LVGVVVGPGNADCADIDLTTDSLFDSLHGPGLEVAVSEQNNIKTTSVRPRSFVTGQCER
jgi:hypothetical protein